MEELITMFKAANAACQKAKENDDLVSGSASLNRLRCGEVQRVHAYGGDYYGEFWRIVIEGADAENSALSEFLKRELRDEGDIGELDEIVFVAMEEWE